jgi:hypothetical protein
VNAGTDAIDSPVAGFSTSIRAAGCPSVAACSGAAWSVLVSATWFSFLADE